MKKLFRNYWETIEKLWRRSESSQNFVTFFKAFSDLFETIKRSWKSKSSVISWPFFDSYSSTGNGLLFDGYLIPCWLVCREPNKHLSNTHQTPIRYRFWNRCLRIIKKWSKNRRFNMLINACLIHLPVTCFYHYQR